MNILLIVYDNGSFIHWFPQGIAYLTAVLKNNGHKVTIYHQDIHHFNDEHLTNYLNENDFDVVGLSFIGGYYQFKKAITISQAIKNSKKSPLYILGGHGPAPEPEYFLKKLSADVLVKGEGEETIIELLDSYSKGENFSSVKGISYRQGSLVFTTPERPLIQCLEDIPFPAYEFFPIEYYRLYSDMPHKSKSDFVMPILSSRGCPFKCNFCYRIDKGVRLRDVNSIIDEIKLLQRDYGITYIVFSDELLMVSRERSIEISEAIIKANLKIKWNCNGRLNYATDEVLKVMKKAGCVFINYGIEAYDNETLKIMKKGLTVKMIIKGIENTLKHGISPGFNIIFGNINETRKTLQKGVDFLLKYDDGSQFRTIRPVTPYPGSPLFEHAVNMGLINGVQDFYEVKHTNSDLFTCNFTQLTDEELYTALEEANLQLAENYYNKQQRLTASSIKNLYHNKDASFRGFRQN